MSYITARYPSSFSDYIHLLFILYIHANKLLLLLGSIFEYSDPTIIPIDAKIIHLQLYTSLIIKKVGLGN